MKTKLMLFGIMVFSGANALAQGIGSPLYFCAASKYQLSFEQIQAKKDRVVILNFRNGYKVAGYGKFRAAGSSGYALKNTASDDRVVFVSAKGDKIEIVYDSDFGSKAATAYFSGKRYDLQCAGVSRLN